MRITLPSGTAAELAHPSDGSAPSRGLVLVPDIGGLRPLFDDLCQRLADENGWVVCAPEPWPGREHLTLEERLGAVNTLRDDDVLGDLLAAADAIDAAAPGVPVAVLGFCMGGMYTFKASGTGRFDRAVAFYGMIHVPEAWASPDQGDPLDAVRSDGAAPVLAVVGTEDPYTPALHVDELREAGVEVASYDGAEHGFVHDPSRPAHRSDDAADAWARAIAFIGS